jgi:ribosomal protein S18 acetylase RimI-like enzyme
MALSYQGHPDSEMSHHFRTPQQAERFLRNLVNFPGSSVFSAPASAVAFDIHTGEPAGILLASFVAGNVGHIAEVCVTPSARGTGLAYELIRQAVTSLCTAGADRISLAVTAGNGPAIKLYTRCGFREMRRFFACVWEKPDSIPASAPSRPHTSERL